MSFIASARSCLQERCAARRLLSHGLHHVVDVAPERAKPVAAGGSAVAHDDVGEVELGETVEETALPTLEKPESAAGRLVRAGLAPQDG